MLNAVGKSEGEAALARRLVLEIGITEAQAAELVAVLGANWSSLVREARVILRDDTGRVRPGRRA
jgi:hypothetical protein